MKKALAIILCAVMLLPFFGSIDASAATNETAISSEADFLAMKSDGTYYLADDIAISTSYNGEFKGTLDGNGKTVTLNNVPMFLTFSGKVFNLTIKGDITGATDLGALAVKTDGMLAINCKNYANVTVTGSNAEVTDGVRAGGFVADADDKGQTLCVFRDCYNYGNISVETAVDRNTSDTSVAMFETFAGGFVGRASGFDARFCENNGTVSAPGNRAYAGGFLGRGAWVASALPDFNYVTLQDCVNNGAVTSGYDAGGMAGNIGVNNNDIGNPYMIDFCVNNAKIRGGYRAGGFVGYCYAASKSPTYWIEITNSISLANVYGGRPVADSNVAFASPFLGYSNSVHNKIQNCIADCEVQAIESPDAMNDPYCEPFLVVMGCSSADIPNMLLENNLIFDNNTVVWYTYATSENNAANRIDIATAIANGNVTRVTEDEIKSGSAVVAVNTKVGSNIFEQAAGDTAPKIAAALRAERYAADGVLNGKDLTVKYGDSPIYHTHSYQEISRVEATCTAKGMITYRCSCGDTYKDTIPMISHPFDGGICTICGIKELVIDLRIAYCNLSFENDTHIMYAVKSNDANVKLLVWDAPQSDYSLGSETAKLDPLAEQMTINGEPYTIFKYTGLAAKQMTDDVYVRTCIDNGADVAYGAVHKYSILQYAYNKLGKTGVATTNEKLIKMLNSLLDYGASAQEYHGYKTNRLANADFVQVKLTDGSLSDGFKSGLYLAGEKVTIAAPALDIDGTEFTRWVDKDGNILSGSDSYTLTVGNTNLELTPQYLDPTEGLEFTLINNDTEYAVSSIGTATDTDIIIPKTYNGLPVTRIYSSAFSDIRTLEHVTIPDSVTSIDDWAFYRCYGLTSINIPDSVTSIGISAFYDCGNLTSITFGESSQLESISDFAFYGCSSLTSINILDSVTSIGDAAFSGCSSLTSINIPDSVTSIGSSAFEYCGNLTHINIPDGVTSIDDYAFHGCSSLTSIKFGESSQLESIGAWAFYDCSSLTSINIPPDSVTSIGDNAFDGCGSLASITFGESSPLESIGVSAFRGCSNLTSITFGESSQFESIGDYAFGGCSSLTSINIPDRVTSIGYEAFYRCSGLTSITFGESSQLESIGDYAFQECRNLTIITFGESSQLESIGDYAFRNCTSLTSINIPGSVTSIGKYAFQRCSGLTSITVETGNTVYHSVGNCLIETESKTLIVGCQNSVIPDDESVTSIANWAFYLCSSLTSINIPDSVTSIGNNAFQRCSGLTSINIPDSVTSIGYKAFCNCSNLTDINFSGTEDQWVAITKGSGWNDETGEYTVHCTDGDILKADS